jgi:hypothetical protein
MNPPDRHTTLSTHPTPDAVPGGPADGAVGGSFSGFLKLMRGEDTAELIKDHKAFTLLALIAYRARRNGAFSVDGLSTGEALIGDYKSCGLTQQAYREAKQRLAGWGFATFKGTSKGTIARLIDSRVFDINAEGNNEPSNKRTTNEQRTSNERATSNKNERRKEGIKKKETPHTPQGVEGGDGFSFRRLPKPEVQP